MSASTFGVQLINSNGVSLIDDTNKNMVLRYSGYVNNENFRGGSGSSPYSTTTLQIPLECESPLVFVRPTTNTSRIAVTILPTRDKTVPRYLYIHLSKWWNFNLTEPIEYYVFDNYRPKSTNDFGMQIFNKNAELVFDGEWNFLNLTDVYWIDANKPSYTGSDDWMSLGQFSQGKKIAACLPVPRTYIKSHFNGMWILKECLWINPDTNEIRLSQVPWADAQYSTEFSGDSYLQPDAVSLLMIADVSKLPIPLNPLSFVRG